MDQNDCVQDKQNFLDSQHENVVKELASLYPSPQKPGIVGNQKMETNFASQTPEKICEPSNIKSEVGEFELIRRHKNIVDVFDGMSCSLRLLGLSKKSPTFQNVCRQVEVLTGRKFSYGHLAQLIYLLPEAIQIDKILVHDKETLYMKPEMKIMLLFNVVEGHHEQSDFIALHQLFTYRLVNYFTEHPEACDIPGAKLPDPFDQTKEAAFGDEVGDVPDIISPKLLSLVNQNIAPEQLPANASVGDLRTTTEGGLLSKSSHMHPSFCRHFSEKVNAVEKTQLLASSPLLSAVSGNLKNEDTETVKTRELPDLIAKSDCETNLDTTSEQVKESLGTVSKCVSVDPLPIPRVNHELSVNTNSCASPLNKLVLSANDLIIETPAQSTPKRGMPNSDNNCKSMPNQKQPSSSKAAKRSLDFTFLETDKSESFKYSPENISHAACRSSTLLPKAEESLGYAGEGHRMSQSDLTHQESNHLPGLVSLIYRIFHSINYSAITKEELIHKIIINSFDYDERRQVEEQIEILEKRIPDWICWELAPSGDAMYSIKKISDLNSLQSRIASI